MLQRSSSSSVVVYLILTYFTVLQSVWRGFGERLGCNQKFEEEYAPLFLKENGQMGEYNSILKE
ncbi:hypothetical protein C5167_000395 [Papaver somniferum]|uniref:Uncharacterized protein n=1 Tax=Papaver somniferum TaxID=3469 RepID=A0A4Y7KVA5_PAPSO|nr:hypothetical protein C5167_000395 [Papaver somniferum]